MPDRLLEYPWGVEFEPDLRSSKSKNYGTFFRVVEMAIVDAIKPQAEALVASIAGAKLEDMKLGARAKDALKKLRPAIDKAFDPDRHLRLHDRYAELRRAAEGLTL